MKRLAQLVPRLREKPVYSRPRACHGWADTMAASRALENPAMSVQEILSGHQHATLERIRAQEVVLLVQDSTFRNDGTMHPKQGVGTVKAKMRTD